MTQRQATAPEAPLNCEHQRELFGADEPIADPHWYVIRDWGDSQAFAAFAQVIRALGYRARYTRPYNPKPLTNDYLEMGEHVYWYIYPNQLCRTRIDWHQHDPLPVHLGKSAQLARNS